MKEKPMENQETVNSNVEATQEEMEEQLQDQSADIIKKLEEEKEELNSQFLRMTADFQNYKKRIEKEKQDIYHFANEKLILDLLPIVDNLERAIESSTEEEGSLKKGVDMVFQQFLDILKKNGVEKIPDKGEAFDPNYHHAVIQEDHPDYESNTIIDVFQKGYILNGKVIRPSMVKVAN